MTNSRINDLAIAYAVTVVTYNECRIRFTQTGTPVDKRAERSAYNDMCDSMNLLNSAAVTMANVNIRA